jgi:hypothetical protein
MKQENTGSVRWYRFRTGLITAILVALGAPLRGLGALFGANLLFSWFAQREHEAQWREAKQGHGELKEVYKSMQEVKSAAHAMDYLGLSMFDIGKTVCPTCGSSFSKEILGYTEPQLCMNLRDIHPHYVNDVPPEPNDWAWSWYQRNGYAPPASKCDRIYNPPESLAENPAAELATAGRKYWSEHRNHFWDNGYAVAPQWYIDHWVEQAA